MKKLLITGLFAFSLTNLTFGVYANESGTKLESSTFGVLFKSTENPRTFFRLGFILENYRHKDDRYVETRSAESTGYGGLGIHYTYGKEATYKSLLTLNRAVNFHISSHKQKFSSAGIDAQLEFGLSFLKIGPALVLSYARLFNRTSIGNSKSIYAYKKQHWDAIPCISITAELPVYGFFVNYKEGKSLHPDIKRYSAFNVGVRGIIPKIKTQTRNKIRLQRWPGFIRY